jgi:hypothetical protein
MDQLRSPVTRRSHAIRPRGLTAKAGVSLAVVLVASIALFAAVNASRTAPAPLTHTYASPDALAKAVIDAMEEGDLDRLQALALTEEEFRTHVWPHLPASRPERNVPFDFVWGTLRQNSEGHLRQTLAGFPDGSVELRRVESAGETSDYGDVVVRRDTTLLVAGTDGRERVVRLFGSLIEQDGAWKVFSYVVDE